MKEENAALDGGEMGERIRGFDWSKTVLGPMETWSPTLRTVLRIMLASRFPHILWWGPHYIQFYNDAYRPILGAKHPYPGLGHAGSECWNEIWHIIGPLVDRPFKGGPPTWAEDILLEVRRHGFAEETHFTIAYSPVPDESVPSGIGGVLATVHEITGKVIGDRRVVALRDLGARSAEARTAEEACAIAAQILNSHAEDIPFALLYLIDTDQKQARLAGVAGTGASWQASPATIRLDREERSPWPLRSVLQGETMEVVTGLSSRFAGQVPPGPWSDPPQSAAVVPIRAVKAHRLAGFLIAGISARLQLDDQYRDFLGLVASQIATAIASAREYEEEKKRAEALAEIDRAKTAFFSNVSHEFRTPLALMLGPIEELLARQFKELPPGAREQLEIAHRNSLRLLRLVNTLLDFSRIEAGRVQAVFEPTDLAAFTVELTSVFRAATERAGLKLTVDCPTLDEPIYVDREMWEKVVLNLLSNAFKFTFEGEIKVTLRRSQTVVELRVQDTGVGIPAEAMPHLFARFHRVENTRGRTHEGSGIGLALVQELIKLHGGTVHAESSLGNGSTFTVRLPLGKDHLPAERINGNRTLDSTNGGAATFVEEALRWLPTESVTTVNENPTDLRERAARPCPTDEASDTRARVLVADDNADMRQYLARLLAEHYNVLVVPDGRAALAAARERIPDLILSDIMMPQLDGIGLLHELRADERLRTIPIILLSARTGEEARVQGLQEGADDYVVKPFSARELLARVAAHLSMARMRKNAEQALRESEQRLEVLVAERTAQLQELVSELEHFSYSITHDMRAPLRAMKGFAELLSDDESKGPEDRKLYLGRIITAAERMDGLIGDALYYSKTVREELPLAPVNVNTLLRDMLDSYPEFRSSKADIQIPHNVPLVMGNDAGLTQCFSNLIGNAVKFVEPSQRPNVRIWCEARADWVRIWVEDQGIGISESMLPRIFDMFSHGAVPQAGTGIGLALVRKVVQRMGGKVGVESQKGQGSRFWLELRAAGETRPVDFSS
jgi:signal transduction histidine kinase